jgi:hypothetical protein
VRVLLSVSRRSAFPSGLMLLYLAMAHQPTHITFLSLCRSWANTNGVAVSDCCCCELGSGRIRVCFCEKAYAIQRRQVRECHRNTAMLVDSGTIPYISPFHIAQTYDTYFSQLIFTMPFLRSYEQIHRLTLVMLETTSRLLQNIGALVLAFMVWLELKIGLVLMFFALYNNIRTLSTPVFSFSAFSLHTGLYAHSSGGNTYCSTSTSSAHHHTNIDVHGLPSFHLEWSLTWFKKDGRKREWKIHSWSARYLGQVDLRRCP